VTIEDIECDIMLIAEAAVVAIVEGDSALLLKNRHGATGFVIGRRQLTKMLFAQ